MGSFVPIMLSGSAGSTSSQVIVTINPEGSPVWPTLLHPNKHIEENVPIYESVDGISIISINGVLLSNLSTGILKNTTSTGKPSIAVASDFPTLNQSTTGNAATATLATNAITASNLADGSTYQIPFQTSGGTTAFIAAPTVADTFLIWDGSAFEWSDAGNVPVVTGTPNQIVVSNSNGTVALSLPQDIGITSAPILVGTNFTAIPNEALLNNSVTVGTTSVLLGGVTTVLAGLDLIVATDLVGTLIGNAASATALSAGSVNQIPVQMDVGNTAFITAPTISNTFLEWNGLAFEWTEIVVVPPTIQGTTNQIVVSTVDSDTTISLPSDITGLNSISAENVITPAVQLTDGGITTVIYTTQNTVAWQVVDSIDTDIIRVVKYLGHISSESGYQACEILILQDGTNVWIDVYSDINTSGSLGTFDAMFVGSSLNLIFSPVNPVNTIKLIRTTVLI